MQNNEPYRLPCKWSSAGENLLDFRDRYCGHKNGAKRRFLPPFPPRIDEAKLATPLELSDFLASVERRAFKQAVYAVKDGEAALDIVQDAMLKLAESYPDRPSTELPMLFQRILQNVIRDWYRRSKVRSTWTSLFSSFGGKGEDDDERDFLETLEAEDTGNVPVQPSDQLAQAQLLKIIEEAIVRLPARQREAFMLRYWEELDVAETAAAMGCSEGSVKTHCSRATQALSVILRTKGITLDDLPRPK